LIFDAHSSPPVEWITALRWTVLLIVIAAWPRLFQSLAARNGLTPVVATQLLGWRWRAAVGIAGIEFVSIYPTLLRVVG
jgi:hypothetical protein